MTDGANDDPGSISLDRWSEAPGRRATRRKPVRVIGIGISQDADYAALKRISSRPAAQAYRADTPEDILDVFAQAIASR